MAKPSILDDDTRLGGDPAERERQDAALDAVETRAKDEASSASDRQYAALEARLAEMADTVKRLQQRRGSIDEMAEEVLEAERERVQAAIRRGVAARGKTCVIQILPQGTDDGHLPVHISVNGVKMEVERGKPTVVPVEYLEVLDHSRESSVIQDFDENGQRHQRRVNRLCYPYMVLSGSDLAQLP